MVAKSWMDALACFDITPRKQKWDQMNESRSATSPDVERREFLRRAATIGWSTPVILTLMASSASASHESGCIHLNNQCGTFNGTTEVCDSFPGSNPPSAGNCCQDTGPTTCQPTVPENGRPCICVDD